jgi:hypothetical protein
MTTKTNNINSFVEETDFWKATSVTQTGIIGAISAWFLRASAKFLKRKNNTLNNLEEKMEKLEVRVSKIEEGMVVTKSDGRKVSLSKYVQDDVKHALDNNEKGIAGFMEVVLSKMNEKDDVQARINQQILIKLNQLSKNDK